MAAAVGRFADGRFAAESWHRIGWGSAHYAASAFTDRDGRPGLVFWLRGLADPAAGWSGAISWHYLATAAVRPGQKPTRGTAASSSPARSGACFRPRFDRDRGAA